jgi:hypothetical protein
MVIRERFKPWEMKDFSNGFPFKETKSTNYISHISLLEKKEGYETYSSNVDTHLKPIILPLIVVIPPTFKGRPSIELYIKLDKHKYWKVVFTQFMGFNVKHDVATQFAMKPISCQVVACPKPSAPCTREACHHILQSFLQSLFWVFVMYEFGYSNL